MVYARGLRVKDVLAKMRDDIEEKMVWKFLEEWRKINTTVDGIEIKAGKQNTPAENRSYAIFKNAETMALAQFDAHD
eukprot:8832255-Karenia_brevis.AAC.1